MRRRLPEEISTWIAQETMTRIDGFGWFGAVEVPKISVNYSGCVDFQLTLVVRMTLIDPDRNRSDFNPSCLV